MFLILQLFQIYLHLVHKLLLLTESDKTVHLVMQFTTMLKGRSKFF